MKNIIEGKIGEIQAQNYLKKKGYKILETNYKNSIGEIDIICKHKNEIVFVEVKRRSSNRFGMPREAVGAYKQNKIRMVATMFLQHNNLLNSKIRFDVIDILGEEIEHIIGCF